MDCPHLTAPLPHPAGYKSNLGDPQECRECKLLLRRCPQCDALDRVEAAYCTSCGSAFTAIKESPHHLLPPGDVRDALVSPPKYPLTACLHLKPGYLPYTWLGDHHGIFVLTRNTESRNHPLGLHLVPGHRFSSHAGVSLSAEVPSPYEWVQRPLLSAAGLFIACLDTLHFFPSHGYESAFPHLRWQLGAGEQLLGIAAGADGEPALLVSNAASELELLLGNTQSGMWGVGSGQRVATGLPARHNQGYVLGYAHLDDTGTEDGGTGRYWIYSGQSLVLLGADEGTPAEVIHLDHGARPARLLHKRIGSGYFDPILFKLDETHGACAYPKTVSGGEVAKPAMTRLDDSDDTRATVNPHLSAVASVEPDPWGLGFMVVSDEGLQRFGVGYEPLWSEARIAPCPGGVGMGRDWLMAITAGSRAAGYSANSYEIALFDCRKTRDNYTIRLLTRVPLPAGYEPVQEMPPVAAGGDVFIALRQGSREDAPVYIYQLQIL